MTIEVRRDGRTARVWTGRGRDAKITTRPAAKAVDLSCYIPVTKGESEVSFRIKPDSFEELAMAMMKASRKEAIRAFGAALQA